MAHNTKYKWYHGLLLFAGLNLANKGLEYLTKKAKHTPEEAESDRQWYRSQKRPLFAPPGKAFPIAWTINNIASIYGNLRVLNMPENTPGRQTFLNLQSASWLIYMLFNAAHFGLKSPLNAAGLTIANTGLTIYSEKVALSKLKDSKVAIALAPTLAWLSLAVPTAIAMASWNKDELYHSHPLLTPETKWLKQSGINVQLSPN